MANVSLFEVIRKYSKVAEGLIIAGAITGYLFRILHYPGGADLVMVFFSLLAALYFLTAFLRPEINDSGDDETRKRGFTDLLADTILVKVLWIGNSVCVIGLQFALLHLKGAKEMLLQGGGAVTVGTFLALIFVISNRERNTHLSKALLRSVPLLLLCYAFYATAS